MEEFSKRLRETIKNSGLTQSELAKMINMSQGVVNNYCTGKREPSLIVLKEICRVLNESSDYLLGLKD